MRKWCNLKCNVNCMQSTNASMIHYKNWRHKIVTIRPSGLISSHLFSFLENAYVFLNQQCTDNASTLIMQDKIASGVNWILCRLIYLLKTDGSLKCEIFSVIFYSFSYKITNERFSFFWANIGQSDINTDFNFGNVNDILCYQFGVFLWDYWEFCI